MPYITQEDRDRIQESVDCCPSQFGIVARSAGELNYVLTSIIVEYLEENGLSYATCNEIMGVLDCARQEFYRRVVTPYEDKAIKRNGDVY